MSAPRTKPPTTMVERKITLGARCMPASDTTWLQVAEQAARDAGAALNAVLTMRRHASAVRARSLAYRALRAAGYSTGEIGQAWGVDHSTVMHSTRAA